MKPDEIPAAFTEAWNAGDSDAVAALFAEDAEFVNVTTDVLPGAETILAKGVIRRGAKYN